MEQSWKSQVKRISNDACNKIESILEELKFQNIQYISEGAQALLLKAYSITLNKEVALKISKDYRDTYELLKAEYDIIKGIQDATNIITFYDCLFYEQSLITILIQELCEKNLSDEMKELIKNNNWYTEEEMVSIIMQICNALTQIHCYKIIHFDIKPENILKSKEGTYKLCDFGLSKIIQQDKSYTYNQHGFSPKYISPEGYRKHKGEDIKLNCQVDIYTAGIVFLEILGFKLSDLDSKYIRKNQFDKLADISGFKYKDAFNFIKEKMLCVVSVKRILSYKLMNNLLQCLPFTENNLESLLQQIEFVEEQLLFDNNKDISFILNIHQFYLLTKSFIYDTLQDIPNQNKALLFQNLAWVYYQQGKYQLAIDNYEQSIKLYKIEYPLGSSYIVYSLNQICNCYNNLLEHQKSIESGLEALDLVIQNDPKNYYYLAQSLKEVAWSYLQLNNPEEALEFAEQSMSALKLIYDNKPHENKAQILNVIGCIHKKMGNMEQALFYKQESLSMFQQIYKDEFHPNVAVQLFNLGNLYEHMNDYSLALQYYDQSLKMRKCLFDKNHISILHSLCGICSVQKQLGNVEQVKMLEKQIETIKDHLFNEGLTSFD